MAQSCGTEGTFYYPRSSLRFILRVADSGFRNFVDFGEWGLRRFTLSVVAFDPNSVFNRIATIPVAAIAMFYSDLHDEREKFANNEN